MQHERTCSCGWECHLHCASLLLPHLCFPHSGIGSVQLSGALLPLASCSLLPNGVPEPNEQACRWGHAAIATCADIQLPITFQQ